MGFYGFITELIKVKEPVVQVVSMTTKSVCNHTPRTSLS